ncbi:unnamed protein product [Leptosia nina]|uniref:Uncharacterized protein n=1 Tax=Leptosia nina TaxID=320188 RepID=A0AAV1IU67_9NEOP
MRRRVQAQRKFAMGTTAPNSRQHPRESNIDRISDTPPEDTNVFAVHSSTRSMLDVVSFEAMHQHIQPVVRLKRLQVPVDQVDTGPVSSKRTRNSSSLGDDDMPVDHRTNGRSKRNNPCPSDLINSVPQIFLFRETVLKNRCYSCTKCKKITLVSNILKRIEGKIDLSSLFPNGERFEDILTYIDLMEDFPHNGDIFNDKGKKLLMNNTAVNNKNEVKTTSVENVTSKTRQSNLENVAPKKRASDVENVAPSKSRQSDVSNVTSTRSRQANADLAASKSRQSNSENGPPSRTRHTNVENGATSRARQVNVEAPSRRRQSNVVPVENSATTRNRPSNTENQTMGKNRQTIAENITKNRNVVNVSSSKGRQSKVDSTIPTRSRQSNIETTVRQSARNRQRVLSTSSSSDDEVLAKKTKNNIDLPEAPVFRPTPDEFKCPIKYIESRLEEASKFGLCKIIPPDGFKPPCKVDNEMRFGTTNHYIGRMFRRWGSASRQLATIKVVLAPEKVPFKRPPLLGGIEVNLPKLFDIVQSMGGLKSKITAEQWDKIAKQLDYYEYVKNPGPKLEKIYVKYLLPYDTMSSLERSQLVDKVGHQWAKRNQMMLNRASSPLHRQKSMLSETDSSDSDDSMCIEDRKIYEALAETEDCIVAGRAMTTGMFKKVAETASKAFFASSPMSTEAIELAYWRVVGSGAEHVCVNAASIDTGASGFGFPNRDKEDSYTRHPWNLKRISEDPDNILSFLGPVGGMTVPTMHLGMVFSTSCLHRDPHGLPWIEYMHEGADRVWYGINNEQSEKFRAAVESLCPTFCQNKSVWLPSDITVIPPNLLREKNVSLCRTVQRPGEFIIVCPNAYSCSLATGMTMSESVYFATSAWVKNLRHDFEQLRNSCEPSMFPLEQLLLSFVKDASTPVEVLKEIQTLFNDIIEDELRNRRELRKIGLKNIQRASKIEVQEECEICRKSLYLSWGRGLLNKKSVLCSEHTLLALQKPEYRNMLKEKLTINYIVNYTVVTAATRNLELILKDYKARDQKKLNTTIIIFHSEVSNYN